MFQGCQIADIGSGLGIDGVFFARHGAEVTFADIVEDNLKVLQRICELKKVKAKFYFIDDFFHYHFENTFDVFLFIGSLLHAPFEFVRRQVKALIPFHRPGGKIVVYAYPKERYEQSGARDFTEFGRMTDGERTPWAEWYDDNKIISLFGNNYKLEWSRNFGKDNIEFNWFDLTGLKRDVVLPSGVSGAEVHAEHSRTWRTSALWENFRGESLFKRGETDNSFQVFRKALEREPALPVVHNNLGVLYWSRGEREKAAEYLRMALQLDPGDPDIVFNCENVGIISGEHEKEIVQGTPQGDAVTFHQSQNGKLRDTCLKLEDGLPLSSRAILEEFDLLYGHPWSETAGSALTSYYSCLHGVVTKEVPRRILEIGTAFGMSAAAMLKACKDVELFISIDLGIYGKQLGAGENNIDFARSKIHDWCRRNSISEEQVRFYRANTQPEGKGDNEGSGAEVLRWHMIPELVRLSRHSLFDVIFIDGKHTGEGLLNDLNTFWPFLKPGGLAICDDVHDETYDFPWAGDTDRSFHRFLASHKSTIADYYIWNYPQVPPAGKEGLRPFGFIRKSSTGLSLSKSPGPEVFNPIRSEDYLESISENGVIVLPSEVKRVWIDVGAHEGETTLAALNHSDDLAIIAFEPLIEKCEVLKKRHPRIIALPVAISEDEGHATFFHTENNVSSSLRPFDPAGLSIWRNRAGLDVVDSRTVPTMRLESLLKRLPFERVDFLKVDAQGSDLDVIKSAGDLLHTIDRIQLEVAVTPVQLYKGASTKDDILSHMTRHGFQMIQKESQTDGQEENLTFINRKEKTVKTHPSGPAFSPARAYWNQRMVLDSAREKILALADAVDNKGDLWTFQWAQLMAAALEFRPDLILELGRGKGNSTCAFTEVANLLNEEGIPCKVVSICISEDWEKQTQWNVLEVVPEEWFRPLRVLRGNILTFDYDSILQEAKRCLVFWDAHGFDVAECVLGRILPRVAMKPNLVIMHDLSDARYIPPDTSSYGGNRLWRGNDWSGPRVRLGNIDSSVEQAVAIVDFTSRNNITLDSADHIFDLEIRNDEMKYKEMQDVLGDDLFNLGAHWFWFTLNGQHGSFTFPDFHAPVTSDFLEVSIYEQIQILGVSLRRAVLANAQLREIIQKINRYLKMGKLHLAEKIAEKELGHLGESREIVSRIKKNEVLLSLFRVTEKEIDNNVLSYTREELRNFFQNDPYSANFIVNKWEYATGQTELTTYPYDVCIPISDICNARCPFCNSWLHGKRFLGIDEIDRYQEVLIHTRYLGLAGHGEPLLHPQFEQLMHKLRSILDERCLSYIITNGVFLDRYIPVLRQCNVITYQISLNAASPNTHQEIMHTGEKSFERILSSIRRLTSMRDSGDPLLQINISLVLVNQNIHEAAEFIALGNRLRVNNIYLRTLAPQNGLPPGLNYHILPPYLHPDYARHKKEILQAIKNSHVPVHASPEAWETPIFTAEVIDRINTDPPRLLSVQEALSDRSIRQGTDTMESVSRDDAMGKKLSLPRSENGSDACEENIYNRTPRHRCRVVYNCLYLNDFYFKMVPCCYMVSVPGFEPMRYDGTFDFFTIWNSPAMIELRKRLVDGPLFNECKRCPPML